MQGRASVLPRFQSKSRERSHPHSNASEANSIVPPQRALPKRLFPYRRRPALSALFSRPSYRRLDIVFVNLKLGESGAHLFDPASLQGAQNDGGTVGAHVEILHPGETVDHLFRQSDLILGSFFCQQCPPLFQGNKEILPFSYIGLWAV